MGECVVIVGGMFLPRVLLRPYTAGQIMSIRKAQALAWAY